MGLSKLEQETTILFNEAEEAAEVYTHNGRMKRRLAELQEKHPEQVALIRSDADAVTYSIPKAWVRINGPRAASPLTEEQKAQRRERLKAANDARKPSSPPVE